MLKCCSSEVELTTAFIGTAGRILHARFNKCHILESLRSHTWIWMTLLDPEYSNYRPIISADGLQE